MLGDQAAPRERGGELGAGRHVAHVAIEREHQADAGDGAVDAGDDRLLDRQHIAAALGEVGRQPLRRPSPGACSVACPQAAEEAGHVGAGAEAAAGAGDHDCPHGFVGVRLGEGLAQLARHHRSLGVELVGAVERDGTLTRSFAPYRTCGSSLMTCLPWSCWRMACADARLPSPFRFLSPDCSRSEPARA